MNYIIKTKFIERLIGNLKLGSMNQEAYFSLYKSMKGYNGERPFHEDSGELFTLRERKESQKKNVKTLESMAKAQNIMANVKFELTKRLIIKMYVNNVFYHTDRIR